MPLLGMMWLNANVRKMSEIQSADYVEWSSCIFLVLFSIIYLFIYFSTDIDNTSNTNKNIERIMFSIQSIPGISCCCHKFTVFSTVLQ